MSGDANGEAAWCRADEYCASSSDSAAEVGNSVVLMCLVYSFLG
ncbi:hypothetical protein [Streptomyces sp. NPDC026589]